MNNGDCFSPSHLTFPHILWFYYLISDVCRFICIIHVSIILFPLIRTPSFHCNGFHSMSLLLWKTIRKINLYFSPANFEAQRCVWLCATHILMYLWQRVLLAITYYCALTCISFLFLQDHHHEETTSFEVTVTSDDVSNSEITSNAPIVLGTNNTLSWGINECSSSFQSVSSCETLESYEHHALNTESPKVIVVPFLADSATNNDIAGTVVTNNGVHIPVIKECSIRIDQLKMSSQSHFGDPSDEANIEKIIELPFNSNCATDRSYKTQSYSSDEDSSEFFGFGSESVLGNTYFERYRTQKSIKDNKNKIAERINRIVSVKRPRQIHRKIPKAQQPSDNQIEPINQSRIESTEINSPVNKLNNTNNSNNINNTMKPIPMPIPIPMLIPDRVSSTPSENLDKVEANRKVASSDSSDSDSDVTPGMLFPYFLSGVKECTRWDDG